MNITVDQLVHEATASAIATTYIPTRYPYTYACDFIRQHPQVVPVDAGRTYGEISRSEVGPIIRRWAEIERCDADDLINALADAYLRVRGIEKSEEAK